MSESVSFLDAWINALSQAGAYNKNDLVPPTAVLWPDKERQWEALIPFLKERLPLLTYGTYEPEDWRGPSYWLRCVIAGALEVELPDNGTSIIYLPGVSRQDIRAVDDCPRHLQPLAELQYRGVLWTQKNGRDWTLMAFLQSDQGGLGIEVGSDNATKEALHRALVKLSGEFVTYLKKEAPLRAPFFDSLLNPDDVRRLLLWMNDPVEYPKRGTPEEWQAFCSLCRTKYGFHPEQDGPISAAEKLGQHTGKWQLVWDRYSDSPEAYPNIPDLLRKARPVQMTFFEIADGWPQDNEAEETLLRDSLFKLENLTVDEVQSSLEEIEKRHGLRRLWVWARLNQSPLAQALEHLISLSEAITNPITGATVDEIILCYTETGWKADASVLQALSYIETPEDFNAVKTIIRAIYKPWLEKAVSVFQQVVVKSLAEQTQISVEPLVLSESTCVVFSDALRYDAGRYLQKILEDRGLNCEVSSRFAALPTITPTSKPAVSPIAHLFTGTYAKEFAPNVEASNTQLNAKVFRDQLILAGIQVLPPDQYGDPSGKAWTEMGATDVYGHQHGWKIAHHIQGELLAIEKRVQALLEFGWREVLIVTDHGWLLLPGELPKAELPQHLTEKRKGRCARLKSFSKIDHITIPWYWDDTVQIALAPGIHCYEAGKEYEHGGLSPQECIVPTLSVKLPTDGLSEHVDILDIKWKGLRCEVTIQGATPSMLIDIRTKAGDVSTSLVLTLKASNEEGYTSLPIPNDDRIGEAAFVVVLIPDNHVVAQQLTTIGG